MLHFDKVGHFNDVRDTVTQILLGSYDKIDSKRDALGRSTPQGTFHFPESTVSSDSHQN